MMQFMFFALFIIALFSFAFVYFLPSKPVNPVKFVAEQSGFDSFEASNNKKISQLNILTEQGLSRLRGKIESVATVQKNFFDTLRNQQDILQNAYKQSSDIMLQAQQRSEAGNQDILKLKELAADMADRQRLLISQGQDLIALNNELNLSRQRLSDQLSVAAPSDLANQYNDYMAQTQDFVDQVQEHNAQARQQMARMQNQFQGLQEKVQDNRNAQEENMQDRMQNVLDQVRQNMVKVQESQANLADARQVLRDKMQKLQDQQDMLAQRVADQKQMLDDQRDLAQSKMSP